MSDELFASSKISDMFYITTRFFLLQVPNNNIVLDKLRRIILLEKEYGRNPIYTIHVDHVTKPVLDTKREEIVIVFSEKLCIAKNVVLIVVHESLVWNALENLLQYLPIRIVG